MINTKRISGVIYTILLIINTKNKNIDLLKQELSSLPLSTDFNEKKIKLIHSFIINYFLMNFTYHYYYL